MCYLFIVFISFNLYYRHKVQIKKDKYSTCVIFVNIQYYYSILLSYCVFDDNYDDTERKQAYYG